jgi:subtilisin family serine protease
MRRHTRSSLGTLLAVAGIVSLAACSDRGPSAVAPGVKASLGVTKVGGGTSDYVLIGAGEMLPANLEAQVKAAGGTLTRTFPQIGVAVARAADAGFADRAAKIKGVESVAPDLVVQWVPDQKVALLGADAASGASEAPSVTQQGFNPANEQYWGIQWAPGAIQAPDAWKAGYTGKGVRVAVLDGGIWDRHPDLAPNIDKSASVSMVPGFPFNYDVDPDNFWHGTHVAGIIAAAANGAGVIGIAPEATLVGVKVLHSGSGAFSWVINGILYAATPRSAGGAGADIINMSLGAVLDGKGEDRNGPDKRDYKKAVKELMKAIDRAVWYANRQNVTVIAAAGNQGIDFDAEKDLISTPAGNSHVIVISATAPVGWAKGATNFDRPASYTNYGKSLVSFAAPGGDWAYPGTDLCTVRLNALQTITHYCLVFDYVFSDNLGGYAWAAGTSMAAPAAAGVAALIIQKNGGRMPASQVEAKLLQSSIGDGKTAYYGHGWVNAFRAIQ